METPKSIAIDADAKKNSRRYKGTYTITEDRGRAESVDRNNGRPECDMYIP